MDEIEEHHDSNCEKDECETHESNEQKPKRGRKQKYTHVIILSGVNAKEIHKRYKQNISGDFEKYCPPINQKMIVKRQNFFYNAEKNDRFIIMKDHIDLGCMPYKTDLRCWHDHHEFITSPIGIPIKYVPKKIIPNIKNTQETTDTYVNDYFITVGVVCSFPCMLAYIKNHSNEQQFKNSYALAHFMYRKLYDCELKIEPASDPTCLKEYGGNVSIESYRREFGSCTYIITDNIKRPYMVAVGNWVEEKRCGLL